MDHGLRLTVVVATAGESTRFHIPSRLGAASMTEMAVVARLGVLIAD
jgi:hypothetical protein